MSGAAIGRETNDDPRRPLGNAPTSFHEALAIMLLRTEGEVGPPVGTKTGDPCWPLCNAPDWSDAIANIRGTVQELLTFQMPLVRLSWVYPGGTKQLRINRVYFWYL